MKNSKAILVHPGLMEIREAEMPVLKDTDVSSDLSFLQRTPIRRSDSGMSAQASG